MCPKAATKEAYSADFGELLRSSLNDTTKQAADALNDAPKAGEEVAEAAAEAAKNASGMYTLCWRTLPVSTTYFKNGCS